MARLQKRALRRPPDPTRRHPSGRWSVTMALGLLCAVPAAHSMAATQHRVELKNEEAQAVMVPLGRNHGVSADDDFEVVNPQGRRVVLIYPRELHEDLFWSQALSTSAYRDVTVGMELRKVLVRAPEHLRIRDEGRERQEELREAREARREEAMRVEIEALREENDKLAARRDTLERKLQRAEENLLAAEGEVDLTALDEEGDIDRLLEDIEALLDERDEIQSRREVLAEQDPLPRSEIARLTAEVERVDSRLEQRRRRIRSSRDRTRDARREYVEARREWKELQAEYRALTTRVRSNLDRIRDLAERL